MTSETKVDMDILGGVLSLIIALLFGNWMNEVFDFGWEIPPEWISAAWMILAGSMFAIVFIVLFAVIIAAILASKDRY
jgi:hypothetical protein